MHVHKDMHFHCIWGRFVTPNLVPLKTQSSSHPSCGHLSNANSRSIPVGLRPNSNEANVHDSSVSCEAQGFIYLGSVCA